MSSLISKVSTKSKDVALANFCNFLKHTIALYVWLRRYVYPNLHNPLWWDYKNLQK